MKIPKKYYKPRAGEWIRPIPRAYQFACCDCGLVHSMHFRVMEGQAEFKAYRNNPATNRNRRKLFRKKR